MVRVLQIVPNMQAGGLETFIMNLYRNIDREKVQFDFLVHYQEEMFYDKEIERLGGKIYRFSLRNDNNIIKYIKELNRFFKEHKEYKITHCHMASVGALIFKIAKKYGVKVRIAHSHNSNTSKTLKGFTKGFLIKPLKYVSTVNFACSESAGKFLYKNQKFEVINNAIDITKFTFEESKRKKIREELGFTDEFIIAHVGRFNIQKNHTFLIDIFNSYYKSNKNARLLLIGSGELEDKVKEKVEILKLNHVVYFLGNKQNINEYYSAMDCFLLPSLFEGLPVVGIEAQVAGLQCAFSDKVTKEAKISSATEFLGLEYVNNWVKYLEKIEKQNNDRKNVEIQKEKYDIQEVSRYLQEKYINYYKEN